MISSVVSAVIDQLADELKRSVVINDPAMQMLYASAHFGDEDQVRVRAVLNHGAEPRARGHVLAQGVSTWTRAGLIPAHDGIGMHARVCVPICFRGELLALLMVMDADGSITTAELGRVNEIAQELASALHHDRTDDETGHADEQIVPDLVGPDVSARRRAIADLHERGRGGGFASVTVAIVGVDTTTATSGPHVEIALRHATTAQARALRWETLVAVSGHSATLVVGTSAEHVPSVEQYVGGIVAHAHEFADGHFRCVAGIGSTGDGLDHAASSFAQAGLARRAASLGLRGAVTTWTSLGALGPLLSIPTELLTASAVPAELQILREVDPDGQLSATLRAFVETAGNGPAAAARLHIHRTSLYYRLGRIRDLTGLDGADGGTRLAVHVGFAMLDIIAAQARLDARLIRQTEHTGEATLVAKR